MAEYKPFEPLSNKAKKKIMDKKKKKPAEKKKKTLKKKIKEFSNRKSKEYKKSAQDNAKRIFGGSPYETKKQSIPSKIADGLLFLPKNMRSSAMQGINKKINTKEERKAAGLDYKVGGVVKDYSLSADDKRRRKAFKSGAGKGRNNTGMKKIKMKEGGMLKAVPEDKKESLGKLPTPVRKKMGFMKEGGMVIVDRNYLKGK